jgi:membrane protein implicated in regulation of membrane protease activity
MIALLQLIPPLPPVAPHEVVYGAMVTGGDIALAAIIFGTMSGVLYPLVRAFARRLENRGAPPSLPSREVEERLDRIERAVESIAVEVERVSEGQRFVTKLLAERAPTKLPASDQ